MSWTLLKLAHTDWMTALSSMYVTVIPVFVKQPSRLPPVALSIAPDLPSADLQHTPPPVASSSSKRPHADLDGGELRSQKMGHSESTELVPPSEPEPRPMMLLKYDGLEHDTIPEAIPDKALPDKALPDEAHPADQLPDETLPDEAQNPDHIHSSQGATQPDQQPPAAPIDHIDDLDQNREEGNRSEGNRAETQMMGWTDEDLDELHCMACLQDAQDAMAFITALCKASLDDPHAHLPAEALDQL
ncbi:hypothetical protein BDR05DRAFT_998252 [Suillus weaverae]|nr:hypothetical protein BDR05DRAFT_998252 [Suillus weaverae]